MLKGHGGDIYALAHQLGCSTSDIIDMSSNVNPVGPPPGLNSYLKKHLNVITTLPEVDAKSISKAFAENHDIDPKNVLAGSGTTEFIYTIPKDILVYLKNRKSIL